MAITSPSLSVSRPVAPSAGKLQSLDGLRAIAILLVLFHHLKSFIPIIDPITAYFQAYVWQGWIGVDLFFVLSGFLITGLLIDSRGASNYFSGFYMRRILRIFPLYYLVLIGLIVASQVMTSVHTEHAAKIATLVPLPQDRWVYFCFLTNWTGLWKAQWDTSFSSILAHFWSLALEEQFYFFWPLLIWITKPRFLPWLAGALAGLSIIIRFGWAAHIGVQMLVPPASIAVQVATISRLDALFAGALGAYFLRDPRIMQKIYKFLPWVACSGIGLFFAAFSVLLFFPNRVALMLYGPTPIVGHSLEDMLRVFLLHGGFTLLAVGFGALVLLAAYTETKQTLLQRFLQSRALAPIGKYSYGIYVFHVPILGLASTYLIPKLVVRTTAEAAVTSCAYLIFIAAASYAAAALSFELFEKKILRLKRNFEPRYDPAPVVEPVADAV